MKPAPVISLAVAMLGAAMILVSGCTTTRGDPDPDSDLPWNTPADWEGSPTIPGLSGYE